MTAIYIAGAFCIAVFAVLFGFALWMLKESIQDWIGRRR